MDLFPPIMMKPIPRSVTKFVCDYDISSIGKMLRAPDGRSYDEKVEALNKNLESFKRPSAREATLDEDFVDFEGDDDDEEEEEDEDDEELISDEKKRAGDVELQVPNEGERECKKPRLSKSFECQGLGEEIESGETSNSN
ncbi:hypothetical protein C2845_PM01G45590 [Panicum miliaceum]|uniref:Uncharacterized protein n=1 Tax=Panicum miliaceum TaxID=4540 RepID=A0A3L6TMX7_PANMI|nr:hypothetical protein C2845_PM01G45590 [Panicum miliaceum]